MAKKGSNKDVKKKDKPTVNPDLEGFNIEIDSFGELKTNYSIDKINEFLNKNVDDKKLIDRDDIKKIKSKKTKGKEE
jgi:hypothetical protein